MNWPGSARWLPAAILTLVWWGLFGFLAKVGSDTIDAATMQVLFTAGAIPLAAYMLMRRNHLRADNMGRVTGTVIGIIAGLGGIAYFAAMSLGKASLVGPVTSLFPLVTVILAAVFLKERINRKQMAGVVLALISAALLSA